MRVVSGIDDGIKAVSTRGLDVIPRFPEMEGLADHLRGHQVVLDGEVVAFDGHRTDFGRLQHRMHVADRREALRRAADVPVVYVVFDLLHLDGIDTMPLAYEDRRRVLLDLVEPGGGWSVPPHQIGDGAALKDAAAEQGLEGVVAKRLASRYEPGRRSPAWRKVKVRRRQELVVGGWTRGEGNREGSFGGLLVGHHADGDPGGPLEFAGSVGTGFDQAELTPPPRPARGPRPRRVARSASRCRRPSRASAGSSPRSSWRWSSRSGPRRVGCATPPTSGSGSTPTRRG